MTIDWLSIGVQTGLIAAVLAGFLLSFRLFAERWLKMAFVRWMKALSEKASDEDGSSPPSGSSSPGALNIAGLKIDPALIQTIAEYGPILLKMAQQFGLMKGGGGSTGGSGL